MIRIVLTATFLATLNFCALAEAQPIEGGFDRLAWLQEGVPCILEGSCQVEGHGQAGECLRIRENFPISPRVVGDACGIGGGDDRLGKFFRKISKFFGGLSGLLGFEFSLAENINIVVIYAPASEEASGQPATIGGSPPRPSAVPVVMVRFPEVVYFEFDSDQLDRIGYHIIQSLVAELRVGGLDQNQVIVVGHADNVGPSSYNQTLSEKRSENVKSALVYQSKLASVSVSIEPMGAGETQPIEQFSYERRSQLNRRVEFFFSTSNHANRVAVDYIRCLHLNRGQPEICYKEYLAL